MTVAHLFACAALLIPNGDGDGEPDRLSVYANGRLRAESTIDQTNGEDRHRGRMRFRVGAKYKIAEGLKGEVRLSSASDGKDANNPHWDFGDGSDNFQGLDIVLDRFFLSYSPLESVEFRAGKFPHAFTSPPVFGEFIWDGDVHPAGVTAVWNSPANGNAPRFDIRLAEYVVEEKGSDSNPSMFGLQGNMSLNLGEHTELHVASGVQSWSNIEAGTFGNQGNTLTAAPMSTVIDGDFLVWESFVSARHDGGPLGRQQAFVQYVNNLDDETGEDAGLALGLELGKRDPGDTSAFAAWFHFDANAFFSPVAQDDTPIPGTGVGTGMKGFMAGVRHIVGDRLSIRLWGLYSDADASENPWRVRLDFDFTIG